MNQQQREFVDHYIAHGLKNATRSAIAAGYSPRIAGVRACKLKKNPEIRSAIADRRRELSKEFSLDRQAIVLKLLEAYYTADTTTAEIQAITEIAKLLGYHDNQTQHPDSASST